MGRTFMIVISGVIALMVLFPMVQASLEGDAWAIFFTVLVVVAVFGNWIAARTITKRRTEEAARQRGGWGS